MVDEPRVLLRDRFGIGSLGLEDEDELEDVEVVE